MNTYKVHNNEQIPHSVRNDGVILGKGGFGFSNGFDVAETKSYCGARQLSFRTARSAVRNLINNPIWGWGCTIGYKHYELTDHLGNVRVVFGDRLQGNFLGIPNPPNMIDVNNYYPYGMLINSRHQISHYSLFTTH